MRHGGKLSFGEFLRDIHLVVTSPAHRFAVIQERGASWGSMVLMVVPTYLALNFVGGIYFARDPFPGYSFIPPLIAAAVSVFLKLYLIHICALLFRGRRHDGGRHDAFSALKVVFGYTSVPALLALLLASAIFLLIPPEIGHLLLNVKAVAMSVMVAVIVALFIWNLILVVLALRTVYSMRDIMIVVSFILGSALMVVPAVAASWIVATPRVDIAYVQPILSGRILRFLASDPTSTISTNTKIGIHVDRLAYRLRAPERFELVAFARSQDAKGNRGNGAVIVEGGAGVHSLFSWDDGESAVGRIVGLPGDTIEVVNGNLRIDGQAWDERYLAQEYRSYSSLPLKSLGPSEYFVLPENRNLIDQLKNDLVVDRDRISGREILSRWPLGWWTFRPAVFLQPQPILPKYPRP